MTTIAVTMHEIAADGAVFIGDERFIEDYRKIVVRPATPKGDRPSRIFAVSGPRSMTEALIAWYEEGHKPNEVPRGGNSGWTLVVIDAAGRRYLTNELPYPNGWGGDQPMAFGSGANYAQAILVDGGSARHAVEVAARLDVWTCGKIQVENIAAALSRKPEVLSTSSLARSTVTVGRLQEVGN